MMKSTADLNVFLSPKSIAVIGASERPGSWGSFIMEGLLSQKYPGNIYPVNHQAERIFNLPAFRDVRDIEENVDLVIVAIPEKYLEETLMACGEKKVRGVTVITAGFAETSDTGGLVQEKLSRLTRSMGLRLLGPNVSGTFNLHDGFFAASKHSDHLLKTPVAAVSQGGFAIHDLLASGVSQRMGVGKFIHTGNEADLTVTDFLELFEFDPDVRAIVMYLETIRDGKRFLEVARRVNRIKPIVVYKGGRTADSARAAQSHTGALSSDWRITRGMFNQAGIVISPSMELLLPLAHALIERPRLKGGRIGIITMGGSWGVALADALVESGLTVPEFSKGLQGRLKHLGLISRSSSKNPVDFGATGMFTDTDFLLALGREILGSGEVDAMVLHGFGRAGTRAPETETETARLFLKVQEEQMRRFSALEEELGLPVLIGNHHDRWGSHVISRLTDRGIRVYTRIHDMAWLLSAMVAYGRKAGEPGIGD